MSERETPNPYTLLNLDPVFAIDQKVLDREYFKLQRTSHPDLFAQKPEHERQHAETQASLLNQAYQILKNPIERAKALGQLLGYDIVITSSSESILVETMHWRERLLASEENVEDRDSLTQELRKAIEDNLRALDWAFTQRDFPALSPLVTKLCFLKKILQDSQKKGTN